MVEMTMDVSGWLRKQLEEASPDLLRAMVQEFAEALMGAPRGNPRKASRFTPLSLRAERIRWPPPGVSREATSGADSGRSGWLLRAARGRC